MFEALLNYFFLTVYDVIIEFISIYLIHYNYTDASSSVTWSL